MDRRSGKLKAFGSYHPTVLMTYFLSILLIAAFLSNPVLQTEALLGGILFCATLQRRGEGLRDLGFYLPLFLMVAVTNPIFSHNGVTPLFFLNGNPVTLEAVFYGIALAVTVIGVLLWCKCYSRIMTEDKFLYLFGRAAPKLSLTLSMALRFIPVFLRQSRRVSRAQKAMGLYAGKSIPDRVKNRLRVMTAMISWSLEHAMETSASMKARGYGNKGRTNFSLFRFRASDGALLAVLLLLLAVSAVGAAVGVTAFSYYPKVSVIPLSPDALTVYAAFGILSLLPSIIEGKEAVVWRFYRSRI